MTWLGHFSDVSAIDDDVIVVCFHHRHCRCYLVLSLHDLPWIGQHAFASSLLLQVFQARRCVCDIQGGPEIKFSTCFCQNFVKSSPNLIIFGRQMARMIELCEVHPVSTSPNLCECTTVLKANAPDCCIMLSYCVRKSSNDLIKHTIN